MADDKCHICQYFYQDDEDGIFHGYDHFGMSGLREFAQAHKAHIMKPFDMTAYDLKGCPCRSFNFPLQPEQQIDEELVQGCLLKILKTLGTG